MSHRMGISKAIKEGLSYTLDGTGSYLNNVRENVRVGNVNFQDVSQWPLITVSPGPEMRQYSPSMITYCTLNVYIRIYVRDTSSSQDMVESLIADIETYLDNNLDLAYNVETANGEETFQTIDNSIISINTSEGLLSPDEIGEIALEVRYEKHRGIIN